MLLAVYLGACSRGEPEVTATATAAPTPTPTPTAGASETPPEVEPAVDPADLAAAGADVLDEEWVALEPQRRESFADWLEARAVSGDAADVASTLHDRYGFVTEVEQGYVEQTDDPEPPTRQVIVTRFSRADDELSALWCAVDDDSKPAVQLGSSRKVLRAVQRLEALPGSCGAVREIEKGRFRADISFQQGPLVVQVAAVEPRPRAALKAIARLAPQVAAAAG